MRVFVAARRREQAEALVEHFGLAGALSLVLLERLRTLGVSTPFFIYAGSDLPEHRREARERGTQGSTNNPTELFRMVMATL